MNDSLPTAALADAAVRLGLLVRFAPAGIHRLEPGRPVHGPAIPCQHSGSVDVFLEALEAAAPGAILVIDNQGRLDEACIGDLAVAEVLGAGLSGVVVWGLHRDSVELRRLGLPIWSLGSIAFGPRGLRPAPPDRLERGVVGDSIVTRTDVVSADDDGVVFMPADAFETVWASARSLVETEGRQAVAIAEGRSLRTQLRFREYLDRRQADPDYDFRRHLREGGGAIET
jgi:regulator of RNase E activity RraA